MHAIEAHGLVQVFGSRRGDVHALDGVDLVVPEGSVLALLGPNGAGKTTAVRVLTTLLTPTAGTASVAGFDVVKQAEDVRRRIGLSGQYAAVDEYLTGRENLKMIGRLYHLGKRRAGERADALLDRFALSDAADRQVKGYSGGMRRRLDLAGSLVAQPPVLFLDEPTSGLDPRSRMALWEVIAELVRDGTTLLLTTQYLEEADVLADKIAVIDRGKVIARGSSEELKSQVGGERLELVVQERDQLAAVADILRALGQDEPTVDADARQVTVAVGRGSQSLVEAIRALDDGHITLLDVALRRPTLDDAFLALTGTSTEAGDEDVA
ncbi:MAG: ATP-binding cassette domain-containing protein [Candidatus Nanopelagicales bacterium]|nr:ATP-binding cassette domain-containing protein [Candidatus Nanopelagicales bacterium]